MASKVVPLYISLHLVASVLGLYDGREGRALDYERRPLRAFQPRFSLAELLPEESERVFTQFSVAGLDILDSLPPLHLNTIDTSQQQEVEEENHRAPPQSTPRFPTSRHFPSSAPAFQPPPPPQDRNVFNFQPFPNIYDPFRNFYNLANYPPQRGTTTTTTTSRPATTRRTRRRRPRPTPLFTTPKTTTTTTTTTTSTTTATTTTTREPEYHEYDYHYYDYRSNDVAGGHDGGAELETEVYYDYPVSEADYDYSMTGCPGSLRECLDACSPVVRINSAAYKICVNECLERC